MNAGLTDFRQRWRSRFYWPFEGGGGGAASTNPVLQSITDSQWYRVNGFELSPGNAVATVSQNPVAPGTDPVLVLETVGGGVFYTVQMVGTAPLAQLEIVPTPTGDPAIPGIVTIGASDYEMKIALDPFPTITLVLIP